MKRAKVVIGLIGTKLDQSPPRGDRWGAWRPSVAICQQDDLIVDRYELLYERQGSKLMQQVVSDVESVSPETDVRTHPLQWKDPWDFEEVYASLYQFAREYSFNTDQEEYLVQITTGTHVAQICLFLLTESRHLPGVLLQASPPRRRSKKDAMGSFRLIDLDLSRYDELASRFQDEQQEGRSVLKSGIETRDKKFNQLIDRIERVTLATRAPILLSGPTGAGKTQLAKRIYQLKRHREQVSGELVEVNCATIRGEQSMSTLFGHVKGAFTGAVQRRAGLLQAADGGVLFLDEIGELGLDEQAMLLRAIEEKTFTAVGSDTPSKSDFQLIAGTNRDLTLEVREGRFREDLLARINLWSFRLPGLAQRRDDIDPNIDFELLQFARISGRKVTMNKEARERFLQFARSPVTPWKANFRDLNAAITRMATLSLSGRITCESVDEEIERLQLSWKGPSVDGDADVLASVLSEQQIADLDRFDRVQLAEVILVCREAKSLSDAGRTLFQVSRQAKQKPNDADRLRKYLAKHGLCWDDCTC
ncbi:MAG: RNA repair transcriptional activator RtcR [Rubripirellula sp.]